MINKAIFDYSLAAISASGLSVAFGVLYQAAPDSLENLPLWVIGVLSAAVATQFVQNRAQTNKIIELQIAQTETNNKTASAINALTKSIEESNEKRIDELVRTMEDVRNNLKYEKKN